MKKTLIIIKREYLSRVKKRSFIIMTILGPILMASLMIVPFFVAKYSDEKKIIDVVNETPIYQNLESSDNIQFHYLKTDLETSIKNFDETKTTALLYIPATTSTEPVKAILYFADKQPGPTVSGYIRDKMKYSYENRKLMDEYGIDKKQIDQIKTSISIVSQNIKTGVTNTPLVTTFIGLFGGILIYFSIFMFGSQVMRGVIEEKTSRIVEIIVSSVKPFQLLAGKIVGIGLVGLTQFLLWIVLTLGIVTVFQLSVLKAPIPKADTSQQQFTVQNNTLFPENTVKAQPQDDEDEDIGSMMKSLHNYDFVAIIALFFFYFLFGYLIYGGLFAAIGSAVDSEADTQQFTLPITIPLILSFIMAQSIIENPQGPIAFWLSVFPLTSPIVMMIRLPFGVPLPELLLSMGLLVLGFLGVAWMAAKIYRTGILMYGKKISYRELWKWLKY